MAGILFVKGVSNNSNIDYGKVYEYRSRMLLKSIIEKTILLNVWRDSLTKIILKKSTIRKKLIVAYNEEISKTY